MSSHETGRRETLMRRHIHHYLMQDNQHGLSNQEQYMLNHMLKELYQHTHESSLQPAAEKQ